MIMTPTLMGSDFHYFYIHIYFFCKKNAIVLLVVAIVHLLHLNASVLPLQLSDSDNSTQIVQSSSLASRQD